LSQIAYSTAVEAFLQSKPAAEAAVANTPTTSTIRPILLIIRIVLFLFCNDDLQAYLDFSKEYISSSRSLVYNDRIKPYDKEIPMTKPIKVLVTALLLVGVTGCVSTSDIQVETVQSEKVNLKGYKRYKIVEGSGATEEVKEQKSLKGVDIDKKLKSMIEKDLAKRGKVEVTKNPDFYVAYLLGTDKEALKVKLDKKGKEAVENIPVAAIVLMFIDANSGEIIWMSTAEGEYKKLSREDKRKRLEYTLDKMLKNI
jgi:hypothetical protein